VNINQKILTGVALLAFVVSVCNASWEKVLLNDGKVQSREVVYSPIWQPLNLPYVDFNSRYECHVLWSPLVGVWITIGVLYAGVFFVIQNTPNVFSFLKNEGFKTRPIGKKTSLLVGQVGEKDEAFWAEVCQKLQTLHTGNALPTFDESMSGVKDELHRQETNRLAYLIFLLKQTGLREKYLKELETVLGRIPVIKKDEDVYSFGRFYDHCVAAHNAVNSATTTARKNFPVARAAGF
jgi:hypothetical protein